ncbi:hypothetical protein K474DRAFT_1707522 [Panus rudis PR-1116 ss-1]|nr:hypothetical protein K474DRAFT_1707522 [Panus rudis PR-1116 ss-1]
MSNQWPPRSTSPYDPRDFYPPAVATYQTHGTMHQQPGTGYNAPPIPVPYATHPGYPHAAPYDDTPMSMPEPQLYPGYSQGDNALGLIYDPASLVYVQPQPQQRPNPCAEFPTRPQTPPRHREPIEGEEQRTSPEVVIPDIVIPRTPPQRVRKKSSPFPSPATSTSPKQRLKKIQNKIGRFVTKRIPSGGSYASVGAASNDGDSSMHATSSSSSPGRPLSPECERPRSPYVPPTKYTMISLEEARRRPDIVHRPEGFEMHVKIGSTEDD